MRKLTFILAAAGCVGLAAPAVAAERPLVQQGGPQLVSSDQSGTSAIDEFSSAGKKKKSKKSTTDRSSWGG